MYVDMHFGVCTHSIGIFTVYILVVDEYVLYSPKDNSFMDRGNASCSDPK